MKTLLLFLAIMIVPLWAEDWTVNGKTYHNVTVGEVEADKVHITYDGGIGTIALADLPPDLQKRFAYDPTKAAAAAQKTENDRNAAIQADAPIAAENARLQAEEDAKVEADEKAKVELKAQRDEMAKHPVTLTGYVVEKTPDGLIVQCDAPPRIEPEAWAKKREEKDAGWPPEAYGKFLLSNHPNEASLVDNSPIRIVAYPTGPFSYITVLGAQATIASYSATLPGN